MSTKAKVTSTEAIQSFRNALIIYLSKARPTFEEITSDVARTRGWLENEQQVRWENEVRRRKKNLDEAQNAFFSAKMSNLRQPTVAERMAVTKAKAAFDEAEMKLRVVKKWNRDFSSQVEPLARQLEQLHTMLTHELPLGVIYLTQVVQKLNEYSAISVEPASLPEPAKTVPGSETNQSEGKTT